MAFGGTNPFDRQQKMEGVKHIIAVGAGKGGVGKSTVAANLAIALERLQKKVGLLDADIYGPSQPRMMGTTHIQPNINSNKKIEPIISHNLKTMSIGYMVDDNSAIIWRGPMLFKAIDQFIRDVDWGELDYLVVDLPPGTGDVQLSLVQKVPVSGAVIVSTPQDMALIDVRRCVDMFQRINIPILGVIENMSGFVCPHCEKESALFPKGNLRHFCEEKKIPILTEIPFNPALAESSESGVPFSKNHLGEKEEQSFAKAAEQIISKLN